MRAKKNKLSCELANIATHADPLPSDTLPTPKKKRIKKQLSCITLIENHAAKNPSHTALCYQGTSLHYGALIARVNTLCNLFLQHQLKPSNLVAIHIKRGFNFIIAQLACIKLGLIFIPLSTQNPKYRINWILKNSQANFILTDQDIQVHSSIKAKKIFLTETELEKKSHKPVIVKPIHSTKYAYAIYTSGSTGKPKGALTKKQALNDLVKYQIKTFNISKTDQVIAFSSESFDAAIWETFSTLAAGATLHIFPRRKYISPKTISNFIETNKITIATLPPCILRTMTPPAQLHLRLLFTAGEACTNEIVQRWGNKTNLINAYGLAETTICATVSEPLKPNSEINIGKPINGAEIFILDQNQQVAAENKVGEIHIAGEILADNYLNNEEASKKQFITTSNLPNKLLLKTGDFGKKLKNGCIKYIGRIDNQANINGMRVEPEEVENEILKLPSVKECLVTAKKRGNHEYLIAYIKAKNPKNIDLRQIKEKLKERLPPHMIPSALITLNKIPLTMHDKTDRLTMRL
jgi:bacitracin synthase 3